MSAVQFRGAGCEPFVTSPRQEFTAILEHAVVLRAPWRRRMRATGPDAQRWLNGMVTSNTGELAVGEGCYGFLLNPQGRIQGDLTAFRIADVEGHAAYTLETDADQFDTIHAWLDRYIIMDDVTLAADDSEQAVMLAGASAASLLGDAPDGLQEKQISVREHAATVYRDPSLRVSTFTLWSADAAALEQALIAAGAQPAGTTALEWLRIASSVPQFGQDIRERDLPQETAQQRALHFRKGCYLGQEIVERIHSRGNVHRSLTLFDLDSAPQDSTPVAVTDAGNEIGELTSIATVPLPEGERTIAMGIVRTAAVAAGKPLAAGGVQVRPRQQPFL